MKICLFGATGLLGSEFKKVFEAQKLDFVAPKSNEVSLLKHDKVLEYLKVENPDLIVNCAAYTAVDKAETQSEICFALNSEAVENLVKSEIPLINFSSEYVFNAPLQPPHPRAGEDLLPYFEIPEDYKRDPQSVYGQSKAKAEEALEASEGDWWNIRTSWLWGPGGNNFVSTISRLAEKYDELSIIDDQVGRPTYAPELAQFVTDNFVSPLDKSKSGDRSRVLEIGHYHLQNSGTPVSWAGFAQYFLNQQGWHGKIKKLTTEAYGAPAVRPKNSVLKNTKLEGGLGDWKTRFGA